MCLSELSFLKRKPGLSLAFQGCFRPTFILSILRFLDCF